MVFSAFVLSGTTAEVYGTFTQKLGAAAGLARGTQLASGFF